MSMSEALAWVLFSSLLLVFASTGCHMRQRIKQLRTELTHLQQSLANNNSAMLRLLELLEKFFKP